MADPKCRECGHGNAKAALFCDRCGRALHSQERDPLVGKTIAERYHLLECIGAGGAGVLYRAEHVTLRRRIALKLLHKHLATSDDAVERFRREAITVCEIDNEHIPQVFDFGRTDEGRLFFAMEFLEGETLAQAIGKAPQGQFSVERVVDILVQIADGLVDAHTLGYVHRDLRPRSIFLTKRRGRGDFVKLLDFGLAKLVQPEVDAQRTAMGMTYGDPRYMAPEQARGEAVDRRADLYSLGAIGVELLTGEPPYSGSGPFEILGKVLDAPVPRVRDRRPDCPSWLESVLRMALNKAPADRFQTVTQFLDAMERKQVVSGAPPAPGAGRVAVPAAATPMVAPASAKGPQATLAMPTVAPPAGAGAAGAGRSTMAYPAVKPVRPATFGVGATPAPAAAKPAASSSSSDDLRLLAERVPPAAAASSTGAKPVAAPSAVKPSPVKPAASPAASKPVVAPAAESPGAKPIVKASVGPGIGPIAKAAAPAKAVVIKPTLPSRADPTPRTTAARIEQEAAGWLETAQSLFDEATNPESLRAVQESADAAEAASKLLAAAPASSTGEDVGGDLGENDTLLSMSAPVAAPVVGKPVAAKPVERVETPAKPPVAVTAPAAKPLAKPSAEPAASASASAAGAVKAVPVAGRSSEISKPVAASSDRVPAAVAPAADRSAPGLAAAPARMPSAVEPASAQDSGPSAARAAVSSPQPALTRAAASTEAKAVAASSSAVSVPAAAVAASAPMAVASSQAPAVTALADADDALPDADATLPRIKTDGEEPSATSPAPSDDDTMRHGKLAAPQPNTAPLPKIDGAAPAAEHESSQTPESGPPDAMNNAETAWFAKPATTDGFADDDGYAIARRKTPLWIYAGAAGVLLIAGIAWLSSGGKSNNPAGSGTTTAANPPTVSSAVSPSPASTSTGSATPGSPAEPSAASAGPGAPRPVVVEPLAPTPTSSGPATAEKAADKPAASAAPTPTTSPTTSPTASPTTSGPTVATPAAKAEPANPTAPEVVAKGAAKTAAKASETGATTTEPEKDKAAGATAEKTGKASAKAASTPPEPATPKLAMAKTASKAASEPAEPAAKAAAPAAKGKPEEVAALIKLGKRRLDDGDTDAATGIFARAVELDGGNAEALAGLGSAQYEQGEYDQAVRSLQKAARMLPRKTALHEMLADAQFKAKRYKESAETARKLLKQDPGSAKAKQILERAEKQLGGSP